MYNLLFSRCSSIVVALEFVSPPSWKSRHAKNHGKGTKFPGSSPAPEQFCTLPTSFSAPWLPKRRLNDLNERSNSANTQENSGLWRAYLLFYSPVQWKTSSFLHCTLQPSASRTFPSSHSSPMRSSTMPSPQKPCLGEYTKGGEGGPCSPKLVTALTL